MVEEDGEMMGALAIALALGLMIADLRGGRVT